MWRSTVPAVFGPARRHTRCRRNASIISRPRRYNEIMSTRRSGIGTCTRRSTMGDLAWPRLRDRGSSRDEELFPHVEVARAVGRCTMLGTAVGLAGGDLTFTVAGVLTRTR